ncbi:C1 family peptidase [Haliovirga abyssi]|uniref:F5/8 type C domain-containing protein n=1 Tax=Haliovirga abyssi TaxID=2996794 RepID=A0AAU9DWW8_9FUSO|nr:C1 family peptidase [Haliovirga abyssi]BDU50836.1 hypothetical protein HLVA_14050 [Haliovirga abyssi]
MKFTSKILILGAVIGTIFAGCINKETNNNEVNNSKDEIYNQNVEKNYVELNGEKYFTGYVPVSEEKYRSFTRAKTPIYRGTLPSKIDLSGNMPTPGNQGHQGSCTAWATTYAYKSFQEGLDQKWGLNTTDHLFSPAYVYNQINGGQDRGSQIYLALDLIVKQGAATLSVMPYNQNNYWTQPTSYQKQEAAKYKAKSWGTVPDGDINAIKSHLAAGDAVSVGIPVYPDFNVSASNPVYDSTYGKLEGYHAITLVGYDDSKGAFKLINSWGTNWGFNGYGWISYNLIRNNRIRGYVMTDILTGPEPGPGPNPNPNPQVLKNVALNKNISVSGYYSSSYAGNKAVDSDVNSSRWVVSSSSYGWLNLDLGKDYDVKQLKMKWSTSNYPGTYYVWGLKTGDRNWTRLATYDNSNGGKDTIEFSQSKKVRYIAMTLDYPNSSYYVLYDLQVMAY